MSASIGFTTSNTSSSGSGANTGDTGYYSDNSVQLDLGGAVVDTSTTIKTGLQGEDLATMVAATNQITSNAINAAIGAANNNNSGFIQQISNMLTQNGSMLLWGAFGIILVLNFKKITKAFK